MHFALIEDTAPIARLIKSILGMRGHQVTHFFDGVSFFASLQTASYDFILLDLRLPGTVSSLQILAFLHGSMPQLPILVITAESGQLLKEVQIKYPCVLILEKPFSSQKLFESIEKLQG